MTDIKNTGSRRPETSAHDRRASSGDASAPTSKSPLSRRALLALGAVCVASFIGHLVLFPQLPAMVPTHWDVAGSVNGWSPREAVLGLDLLPLGFLALFYVVPRMDPRGRAYERMGSFYTGFVALMTLFLVAITWTTELTVFGIVPEDNSPIGIFTGTTVGIGFILLGNYLPKIKRNYSFGIKTPWALDDDRNWRLTHRVGGVAMVVAGIATALGGLFSQTLGGSAVTILIASALGASLLTYVYSYLVFRNGNRPLRMK